MPRLRHIALGMVLIGMIMLKAGITFAQDYPNRPIHIVTNEAGGATDILVRLIASKISGPLGQPVVVENQPSSVFAGAVARSKPDGYTLLTAGTAVLLSPLFGKSDYDPIKDFTPISLALSTPLVLVVNPSLPVHSVQELIDYAKANPGVLNYVSTGTGAGSNLAAQLLMSKTGVKMVGINYKGTGPALIGLLGGETQLFFNPPGALVQYIKAGKLRAVAIATLEPDKQFPDLPTVASTLPGFEMASITGFLAPAGTPPAAINRLNQEIVHALNDPEVRQKLSDLGEIGGSTPAKYGTMIQSEVTQTAQLIKDAGLKTQP